MNNDVSIKNPKARFDYEFIDKYVAGIELKGSEVKALKHKGGSIKESFCQIINGEMYLINSYIYDYSFAGNYSHDERRNRRLLLSKKEIQKIDRQIKTKGITVIPYHLFLNDKGLIKLSIFTARGMKKHDKREKLKNKELKRNIEVILKSR